MNSVNMGSPTVGSLVKKMIAINPDLDVHDLIAIVRKVTRVIPGESDGFDSLQTVDEAAALEIARATLSR